MVKITRLVKFVISSTLGQSKHDKDSTNCTPPIRHVLYHGAALIVFLYQRMFHTDSICKTRYVPPRCRQSGECLNWRGQVGYLPLYSVGQDRRHLGEVGGGGEARAELVQLVQLEVHDEQLGQL